MGLIWINSKATRRIWNLEDGLAQDNEKIVFFVGRLVNEKGVHVLIDALPKVCHYYNDVKFVDCRERSAV